MKCTWTLFFARVGVLWAPGSALSPDGISIEKRLAGHQSGMGIVVGQHALCTHQRDTHRATFSRHKCPCQHDVKLTHPRYYKLACSFSITLDSVKSMHDFGASNSCWHLHGKKSVLPLLACHADCVTDGILQPLCQDLEAAHLLALLLCLAALQNIAQNK